MDTVTREDSVYMIAPKVNLSVRMVREILRGYVKYIKRSVEEGKSVSFLRICTINVRDYNGYIETFAYTCGELAKELNISSEVVKGVLFFYEDCIIRDLRKYYDHTITELFKIKREEYNNKVGVYIKRSSSFCPSCDYILSLRHSFKRKVVVE